MLTQKELKQILHYCPDTGVFTWKTKTRFQQRIKVGGRAGYTTTNDDGKTYRKIKINKTDYREHRLAFLYMQGTFPLLQVDHEDGNGTNNAWNNLREATNQENSRNKRQFKTNTTGQTGVTFDKKRNKYRAQITVSGKMKTLGRFENIDDAITVRKAAEAQYGFHANHGQERPL